MKTTDARFTVRKSTPGMGQGLFAAQNIKRGDFILEYTGKKIPTPVADTLKSRYLFEIDAQWTIDGSPRSNLARYINHSCDPNAEADICDLPRVGSRVKAGGRILISAKRAIQKGEELTIDYDTEYFDEFIKPVGCKCPRCIRALQTV
jgi:hypothetical protein